MKGKRTFKRILAMVMAVVFTVCGITFTPKETKAYTTATMTVNDIKYTATLINQNLPWGDLQGFFNVGATTDCHMSIAWGADGPDYDNMTGVATNNDTSETFTFDLTKNVRSFQVYWQNSNDRGLKDIPVGTYTVVFSDGGSYYYNMTLEKEDLSTPTETQTETETTTTEPTTAAPTTTAEPTTADPNPWSETSISGLYHQATFPSGPLSLFTRVVEGNGTIADAYGNFYLHVAPENFNSVSGSDYTLYFGEGCTTDSSQLNIIEYGTGNVNVHGGQYINYGMGLTTLGVEDDKYYTMIVSYTLNNVNYKNTFWFYTGSTRPSGETTTTASPVDVTGVTATASAASSIAVSWTAGSNVPSGQVYEVYLDDAASPAYTTADESETSTTLTGVSAGSHTVTVKAKYNSTYASAAGVTSSAVTVYNANPLDPASVTATESSTLG